jgi:DNA-binding transcriptional MocR family regulator
VALKSIANPEKVAFMLPDRALSGPHLARLLGEWRSSGPAYAALARALRLLVLDGRLPLRTRLPGERELAEALGVSRTTATAAYAALRDEGFLASRRGAGSWTRLPADPAVSMETGRGGEDVIDLSCAACAAPEGALHAALAAATAELPRHLPGPGYDAAGLPVLRDAIAAHLTARGVPTTAEQVLVTNGAQHAWTLLLRVLAGPGDRVLTEHPTYPAALDAIRAIGARAVPVPMLADGWDLDMFEATLRQAAPRLAYVIAEHQNPTGLTLPAAARERLVALARASRTPLVIDDTIAGLHLDGGDAPPPVAALDPEGDVVVTTGSTSKLFWAGMRIGWIRANPALVQRLAAARMALDIASPVLEQLITVELLAGAQTIVARQREGARARRDALAAALRTTLPEWRFALPAGGLSLWIELDAPRSTALAAVADRHGLRLAAGPRFGVDGAFERFVRVPYALPTPVLEDAAGRLAVAWRSVTESAPPALQPAPALVA